MNRATSTTATTRRSIAPSHARAPRRILTPALELGPNTKQPFTVLYQPPRMLLQHMRDVKQDSTFCPHVPGRDNESTVGQSSKLYVGELLTAARFGDSRYGSIGHLAARGTSSDNSGCIGQVKAGVNEMSMFYEFLTPDVVRAVLTNALGTLCGGMSLALFAFFFGDWLFGIPNVHGHWYFVTETTRARKSDYKGMRVTYKALLRQEGSHIEGSGEKVMDQTADGLETIFEFSKRVQVKISGCVRKRYLGRSQVLIHIEEDGRQRPTSALHTLARKNGDLLGGTFTWTASDSYGGVVWSRWLPVAPSDIVHKRTRKVRSIDKTLAGIVFVVGRMLVAMNAFGLHDRQDELLRACQSLDFTRAPSLAVDMLGLGEDRRYYSHAGIDPRGIARAIWMFLKKNERQGGSTIEQQFVRTLTSDFEYTVVRKVREMALATLISRRTPKSRIAHLYLSVAHFGYRMEGIDAACKSLGKDVESLSPSDAAELIARLKYPQPKDVTPVWEEKLKRRTKHLLSLYQGDAGRTDTIS